jgi:hypothetical protein
MPTQASDAGFHNDIRNSDLDMVESLSSKNPRPGSQLLTVWLLQLACHLAKVIVIYCQNVIFVKKTTNLLTNAGRQPSCVRLATPEDRLEAQSPFTRRANQC